MAEDMAENMQIVPASQKVEAQYVEMKVPLYSYGCEKKVKKALSQLKGIYSVSVDHEQQKVTVWGICDRDQVLATIRSKRKGARFWGSSEEIQHCQGRRPRPMSSFSSSSTRSWMLSWKAWKMAKILSI